MKRGMLAGALALIGAILLIVSVFLAWYTVSISASETVGSVTISTTGNENFLPGSSFQEQLSCSGSPDCPGSTTNTTSYSSDHLNATGTVYMVTEYVLIGGFVLGLLGAILVFGGGMMGRTKWMMPGMLLIVLALLMALVAPLYVLGAGPGAFSSDTPAAERANATGPWSSFVGSCSASASCITGSSSTNGSANWGPGAGWYLGLVAFVLFLLSLIFLLRDRRAMMSAPAADSEGAMPAPTPEAMPPAAPPPGGSS